MILPRASIPRGFLLLVALFLMAVPAWANLTPMTVSSGRPGESTSVSRNNSETTVRMAAETVVITLGEKDYSVQATFEFENSGSKVALMVGFPNSGCGYVGDFKGVLPYSSLITTVDNKTTAFANIPGTLTLRASTASGDKDIILNDQRAIDGVRAQLVTAKKAGDLEGAYKDVFFAEETRWYGKSVTFKANGTTTVKVEYTAPYGPMNYVEYIYGIGRSWKGTIGQATFIVKTSPTAWATSKAEFGGSLSADSQTFRLERVDEFTHRYIHNDFEPAEDEVMRFFVGPPAQPWGREPFTLANKEMPDDFPLILSYEKIRQMRESFSAVHGKIFTDAILDSLFRTTAWYRPRKEYSDADLTPTDRNNIAKLDAALPEWVPTAKSDIIVVIGGLARILDPAGAALTDDQLARIKKDYGAGGVYEARQIYGILTTTQKQAIADNYQKKLAAGKLSLTADQHRYLLDYGPQSGVAWGMLLSEEQWRVIIPTWDRMTSVQKNELRGTF